MAFESLQSILALLKERYPKLSKRMGEAKSLSHWDQAVGPMIAKHARAVRVNAQILYVEVDHPIWRSELHHRKRQIIDKLNQNGTDTESSILDIQFLDPRN